MAYISQTGWRTHCGDNRAWRPVTNRDAGYKVKAIRIADFDQDRAVERMRKLAREARALAIPFTGPLPVFIPEDDDLAALGDIF
jgi:hypothetical protein